MRSFNWSKRRSMRSARWNIENNFWRFQFHGRKKFTTKSKFLAKDYGRDTFLMIFAIWSRENSERKRGRKLERQRTLTKKLKEKQGKRSKESHQMIWNFSLKNIFPKVRSAMTNNDLNSVYFNLISHRVNKGVYKINRLSPQIFISLLTKRLTNI